jgi:asparagine synthase (glutamine-hydrolysing)
MSGFAGIVNLDGAPVDRALVERLEEFLHSRGPDGRGQWIDGNVALVHTLFVTTDESRGEQQPMSLDGRSWIVADARIDAREDLTRKLIARGCECSSRRPDAELILHAYSVWGEQCVEHLLGDFAFAIWDARERKLFCARDHFGVRPFFYARVKGTFVFGNSMGVPRLHPDVPDDLNDAAIADFLVLGTGFDLVRTAREAIRRLAPAHVLSLANGEIRTRRYWTLPVDPPTVFRRPRDYVERFRDLFEQAVADRMRTDRAAVLMSGGLDSSSVAAMAKHVADKGSVDCSISAHTQTYHHLIPCQEGHFASLAARKIGIPWNEFPLDDKQLLGYWNRPEFRRPEPGRTPLFDWALADTLGKPLPARVVLTGQGGDGIFSSLRLRHCRQRLGQGRWLELAGEVSRYLLSEGRLRRLQFSGRMRAFFRGGSGSRPFPAWLNPDFERRMRLRQRYEQFEGTPVWKEGPQGAVRPEAYGLMTFPMWTDLFEDFDPDNFGGSAEARHPFFDLRLVRYALSLPALPWCSDKELLRRSMRGLLPEKVRLRRKQPILCDLLTTFYRNSQKEWLDGFEPIEALSRFVQVERALEYVKNPPPRELPVHLRPISLNFWLKWESQSAYKMPKEEYRAQTHQGPLSESGTACVRYAS